MVNLSSMLPDLRFESEYHRPKYLALKRTLANIQCERLDSLALLVKSGPFGSSLLKDTYATGGVIVLRPFNISHATFEDENLVFVSQADIEAQGLSLYEPDDIAFARVGDIRCGVIPDYGRPVTISPNIIVARVDGRKVNPYFLAAFMNTRLGIDQLERSMKVVAQPTITVETVKSLQIPIVPLGAQVEVERLLRASVEKRRESKALYAEAEALLLAELGLDHVDLSYQPTYTQGFNRVWAAGRLDAEHFQPRYYTLLARIQETRQSVRLGDWAVEPIRRGVQPEYDDNGDVIVINSQHVGKTHVDLESNRRTTRTFAEQNPRAIVRPYDVLLNSTGYITIGRCQTIFTEVPAIVDGHVSIIRPKPGLDPVYLGLFLNSLPGQMQTERSWTGSSGQIELRTELIENYTVWKPDMTFQRRLRELVEEAHTAREEARGLLEDAKRRVEEMILGVEM